MKKIIVILLIIYSVSLSAKKNPYPKINNINEHKAGDFITAQGKSKNKYYKEYPKKIETTYGTIVVKENRSKPDSRFITLPVKKLHSLSENPKEPIFLLYGGPGSSNLREAPFLWLLEEHDIVMVGYRGVDGSVSLQSHEIPEALASEGSPLGQENIKRLTEASLRAYDRYKSEGIDIDAYNMIEVIDDFEDARKALGYNKINLWGFSYGTRVSYLFGLRYPESINRTLIEGVNPPGHFVWEPADIDNLYAYLGEQWKKYPECLAKSPDIVKTIENVLASLTRKYKKITINPDKVKMMLFMMAYTRTGIVQTFDAFVAAEQGDYSGIAFLSMAFDQLPNMPGMYWGDNFAKAFSADFDPNRDYIKDMDPEGSLIGSPMSKLFSIGTFGGWPIKSIPEEYKKMQTSNVPTLMISGSIDISTPPQYSTELLQYLPNGQQIVLIDRGHQDTGALQKDAYHKLVLSFFSNGSVDSDFTDVPIDFTPPKQTFQKMGNLFYKLDRMRLTGLVMKMMQ
ncbi:MAG: hypothetical protein C0597_09635 [Marinilabiliales bacterium]|nr:MAG: hypothetical protein C0597_09635 [Marinilabiliales bacterium]